jgi:DNA-binding response OmpR family regulator
MLAREEVMADVRSPSPPARPGSVRVLVVDDSPVMLLAVRLGLGRVPGWEVETTPSGQDAVRFAADYRPDAILLDVMMPRQDGRETLRALRDQESTRDTPVVFFTSLEDHAGLTDLGAAGVIAKPFQLGELAGDLRAALGWEN